MNVYKLEFVSTMARVLTDQVISSVHVGQDGPAPCVI